MGSYLHDDKRVVNETMFVTNRYLYTSKLVEMLFLNPEFLQELKYRMYIERINDSDYFLKCRDGYGKTEFRIVKMMQIKGLGERLKEWFPDLVPEEKAKKTQNY